MVGEERWAAAERSRKAPVLDLDQHYGNGIQIIERLDLQHVHHVSAGKEDRSARNAEAFLSDLANLVRSFDRCQVLLYQAGADPHVNDPLGGWMTTDQLARRDRIVFETAAQIGVPVAWNLAGEYQRDSAGGIEPVLEIHRNTVKACVSVHL